MVCLSRVTACALAIVTVLAAGTAGVGARRGVATTVETLQSVGALPAYLISQLLDPAATVTTRDGSHLVLDRRAHTVVIVDPAGRDTRPLLQIGCEPGRLLQPMAMAISDDDILAVLDAPNTVPRVQYFNVAGVRLGGFFLPRSSALGRLVVDDGAVRSLTSLAFTGRTFVVNEPAWGSVMSELDTTGTVIRQIGNLRPTGRESDPPVHESLNTGIPLVDPTGGFYFVFQTGTPMFRKYTRDGVLVFERHIEGVEIDALVQGLPTTWTRAPNEKPIPTPLVRTAAVDRDGRLWVSLQQPYTYVYDSSGEKVRVVQFRGTSVIAPTHLFFDRHGRVHVTPGGFEFAP